MTHLILPTDRIRHSPPLNHPSFLARGYNSPCPLPALGGLIPWGDPAHRPRSDPKVPWEGYFGPAKKALLSPSACGALSTLRCDEVEKTLAGSES